MSAFSQPGNQNSKAYQNVKKQTNKQSTSSYLTLSPWKQTQI